ncbi:hypothetical protein [Streptomyces sp. NPDC088812]|uniref:hypothetical protein n=1 Tax=Streptomyces sp. NPDC088812 TaxID=3365905 RepID=UPI0037F25D87
MPFPPPPRTLSGPRRRTLLASAVGAALLASCSSDGDSGGDGSDGGPSAAERARAGAARDSAGLVARYDAVLSVHPTLLGQLAPLRAEVVEHMTAFGGAAGQPASPSASPSSSAAASSPASPSASASGASSPAAVPPVEGDALAGLAAAERTLADQRLAALAAVPGELARLLASVAAAGAAHAYLLTEGAR